MSETQGESLAAVSVLTRDDIERLQAVDLLDLLAGMPGVSLSNTGGAGKETSLFLRGTESDHVLVLIDGVKVGSATSGKAALEQIPLDQIERIELVRGPRSSLYGSEAIGGVLQIFTRRGNGGGLVPSFSAFGGDRGSATTEAGLRGGIGKAWYAASLSARTTDGIDAQRSANEPDRDGYEQLAGSLRGGWLFDKGAELSAHWLRADGDSDYDSRFSNGDDSTETRLEVLGAQARVPLLPAWQASLSAGLSRDDSDIELDDVRTARFDTRREHFSWLNELQLGGAHTLTVGADHLRDHVDSTAAFAIDARTDTGAFAQYQAGFDAHELQLSLRHDDDEQFGEHTTGGAAWGWRFTSGLRASASYGSAFRAPSFNELYYPNFGNPDLGPEKARSAEIGLDARHAQWNWSLHAYRTEVDDLIATVLVDPDNFVFAPVNVAEARIVGVEAVVGARWAAWRVQTTLSWLDPEDRSGGASDGKVLRRRAQESGRID
ncbi:MAG: TonB-dependent receptor domain-containing protein, partial [Panacagrimonas sp.]